MRQDLLERRRRGRSKSKSDMKSQEDEKEKEGKKGKGSESAGGGLKRRGKGGKTTQVKLVSEKDKLIPFELWPKVTLSTLFVVSLSEFLSRFLIGVSCCTLFTSRSQGLF